MSCLYIKINETATGPSPHDNNMWFFFSTSDCIELSLEPSFNLSTDQAFHKILEFKEQCDYLIFSDIPFPTISLKHWKELQSHFNIGLVVADSIQFFCNYYEFYTQFIDFAICLGEDDCNYYESSRIPTFFSLLLHENIDLYSDNFKSIKPIEQRSNDLIHIGRLDRGKRSVYINQLKKLPIKFITYGRSNKNQKLSPVEEVIASARESKLGICFTEPNHERSFKSNNKLWEFKVHNKSSFTQLLYSGCVVISEYQPYIMKNFIPDIHFVLLKNNNIERQIFELLSDQNRLQSIQNNLKNFFDEDKFLKSEKERFINFLKNINQYKLVNENLILSINFKFNFIKFNRNK